MKKVIKKYEFNVKRSRLIIHYTDGTKVTWTGSYALKMLAKITKSP